MTFYEEVRSFFKKHDPARVRLAKKIASVYKTPRTQKAAMRRLKEVYAAGGPDKFDFPSRAKIEAPKVAEVEEAVANTVEDIQDDIEGLSAVSE